MASKRKIVEGIYEAWNRRDFAASAAAYAPTGTFIDHPRGLTMKTRDEVTDLAKEWATIFPDGKISDVQVYEAGNTVIATFVGHGTNTGPLGSVPPTGRRVEMALCDVYHFNDKGHIVGQESFYDTLGMLVQLGLAEPPQM